PGRLPRRAALGARLPGRGRGGEPPEALPGVRADRRAERRDLRPRSRRRDGRARRRRDAVGRGGQLVPLYRVENRTLVNVTGPSAGVTSSASLFTLIQLVAAVP